jgi:aldehyde:ferredoxin oxidoreductase
VRRHRLGDAAPDEKRRDRMLGGYMGKFLWVDLSTKDIDVEVPSEDLLRDFLGGYGVAAKVLFDRQAPGVDPLGPDNILGVLTGPLTGTPTITGTRWTIAGKSPLTGTWGDANGSGFFAPRLKFAGYDAVFFKGASEDPVYLFIDEGKAEIRDATAIWGRDTYETEDMLKAEFGNDAEAICIGPAGENLSLISCVVTAKGRVAGRSGLGALMGSKKLKAVVVRGSAEPPLADPEETARLRKKYLREIREGVGYADVYAGPSTPGSIYPLAIAGDSPTKNWAAVCEDEFDPSPLAFEEIVKYKVKKNGCWHCPIACWGHIKIDYLGEEVLAHLPEYETGAALGTNCLNNDLAALAKANDLCNRYGLDTMSAGSVIAFSMECYEKGLISSADTDGIELIWGDGDVIVTMLEKMAKREGFGDVLADGVKVAADSIGPEAEPFAIHVGGQEPGMHDPRFEPGMAIIYQADATPGRHTQGSNWFAPPGMDVGLTPFGTERDKQKGRAGALKPVSCWTHVVNASGICLFVGLSTHVWFLPEFLTAVTGQEYTLDDILLVGERIANVRQAFNMREGVNLIAEPVPERMIGVPPLESGPTADVTVDASMMVAEYLETMDWSLDAGKPSRAKLEELGLEDVAEVLYG